MMQPTPGFRAAAPQSRLDTTSMPGGSFTPNMPAKSATPLMQPAARSFATATPHQSPLTPSVPPDSVHPYPHPSQPAASKLPILLSVVALVLVVMGLAGVGLFIVTRETPTAVSPTVAPPGPLAQPTQPAIAQAQPPGFVPSAPVAPVVPSAPALGAPSLPSSLQPVRTVAPVPVVPAEPAPSAVPPSGIVIHEPSAIGSLNPNLVYDLAERAQDRMGRCRRASKETVVIQLLTGFEGEINIAQPHPTLNLGATEVARCVANVLRAHGPLGEGQNGIGTITLDVLPR